MASGSSAVLTYGQKIFEMMGVDSREKQDRLMLYATATKLLGVAVGIAIVEHSGRRHLLGLGATFCVVGLLVGITSAFLHSVPAVLGAMCAFLFAYFCSWGPATWVVVAELTAGFGPRYGNASQAAASAVLFLASGVVESSFLSVLNFGGALGMLLYVSSCICMLLFAFLVLPETRGCSLEQCAERVRGGQKSTRIEVLPTAGGQVVAV
jgi:hypothetical protein